MTDWIKRRLTGLCYGYLRSQGDWAHPQAQELRHSRVLPYASYAPWVGDAEFLDAYERVREHTLVDIYRLYELWQLARQMDHLEGAFLEVGVWRGGSGCLLGLANRRPGRRLFLADTFAGVVKVGERDTRYKGGEHADTTADEVRTLLSRNGLKETQVLVGMFPEHNAKQVDERIALLHIDVDVYESALGVLTWALPRLVMGAVVVFDDYGFHGCEGVTRLVNEFVMANSQFRFFHNLNGHAVLVHIPGESA
jgi:O-methyltransferase